MVPGDGVKGPFQVSFHSTKLIKRLAPNMTTHVPFHIGVRKALKYVLAHPKEYKEDPEFDAWCDRVIDSLEKAKEAI